MADKIKGKTKEDQEVLAQMRQDCLDSLYVFAKTVCGFDKLTPHLHKDVCEFLQEDPAIRKVLMLPRDHYKSTIVSAYCLWRLMRDPDETILIAGDTSLTAQGKLNKIRQIMRDSDILHILFNDRMPEEVLKSPPDLPGSGEAVTIPRKRAHEEPSIRAAGVVGARAGSHYTIIVCDDIFTKEAKEQPATAQKIIEWADGVEALLVEPYENEVVLVGTPWHHEDVYEHVAGRDGSWKSGDTESLLPFYAELKKPFFDEDGEPIFPELYGGRENALDFAERMAKTNPYLWSANFLLDPQIPNAEFNEADLQYFTITKDSRFILYRADNEKEPRVIPIANCETYIAIDPAFKKSATASKAAINISHVAPDGNIFIAESLGLRTGTDALIDKICEKAIVYKDTLRRIGVEAQGQQQSFIDYLKNEFRRRGIYRRIDPLPRGSKASKEERIRGILQPYFGQKRIWVQVNQKGLLEELRKFPLSEIRDELDAMSYAADNYWVGAYGLHSNYEEYLDSYHESRRSANSLTGY